MDKKIKQKIFHREPLFFYLIPYGVQCKASTVRCWQPCKPLHNYAISCIVCLGLDLKENTKTTMILSVRVFQVILTASSSMLRSLNLSLWLATIGSSESTADLSVLSSV